MSKYVIDDTTLTEIAKVIRKKTGTTDAIPVTEMATRIASITGGGDSGGTGTAFDVFCFNIKPDATTANYTATHNWGKVADCIILVSAKAGSVASNEITEAFCVSKKFKELFPSIQYSQIIHFGTTFIYSESNTLENGSGTSGFIRDVTENSFLIGSAINRMYAKTYQCIMIAIR